MINELRQLNTDNAQLRKFGWQVGGVFLLIGVVLFWLKKPLGHWLLGIGAILLVLGMIVPRILRGIYLAWMGLGLLLGMVVSTVLLTFFFYFVFTPIGFLQRVFGKDPLDRKLRPDSSSYWLMSGSENFTVEDYEKQG